MNLFQISSKMIFYHLFKCRKIFLFLLSFLILTSAQPDWSLISCMLASGIGYAFFWKAILDIPLKKTRFFLTFFWFGTFQAIHLNWFMTDRYVGYLIYPIVIGFSFFLGLQFAIVTLFLKHPQEMGLLRLIAIAATWTFFEWSRLFIFSGYPWDPAGLALTASTISAQFASIFGVYGLSFWVMLTNLFALRFLSIPSKKTGVMWMLLALTPYLFGSIHLLIHSRKMVADSVPPLKALLVQTAMIPEMKMSIDGSIPLSPIVQWENILRLLSFYRHTSPDLILFSEGVVPYGTNYLIYPVEDIRQIFQNIFSSVEFLPNSPLEQEGNRYWVQAIANAFDSDVLIGLEDIEFNSDRNIVQAYNSAFLFKSFSNELARYDKRVLVPMGEYIPFEWCKKILSKYGILDSFTPGSEAKIFHTKRAPIGASICYEEAFGGVMRESRLKGGCLLANLTNDVWYPRSRLPIVHFYHGRIRAIEEGVPLLRACNTGVTCGVDALGRVIGMLDYESPQQESFPGILSIDLPLYHYSTIYTYLGDKPLIYCSALCFLWLCVISLIKRKQLSLNDLDISPLRKN